MEKIKMYVLTKHAEQQYRMGAKQGKNIDISVLNRKISSLIYASEDRFYYSPVDACVAFGTCMITFAQDEVIDIHWIKENHRSGISKSEKNNLVKAYEYFNLDKNGMEFKKESDKSK